MNLQLYRRVLRWGVNDPPPKMFGATIYYGLKAPGLLPGPRGECNQSWSDIVG
jgi:hypothetical protein